ncbi:MAG: sugar transferase [Candidatus Riflebacteria bacterium]|nr:sugar transferase [Candidatus Riflebacteria bacterium]
MVIKRWFDVTMSLWGLIVFAPLFAVVSLIVKFTSKGPVFYIAPRVGQYGKMFNLYKFRTMFVNADKEKEGSITVDGDRRITLVGRFLRKTKIDELPSLFNVLKGDMSFVGPRPDVKGYADSLTGKDRLILNLKPGITGPATLKYANEEDILASVADPIRYNNEVIFPDKVRINLSYLDSLNLFTDLKLILRTIFGHFLVV